MFIQNKYTNWYYAICNSNRLRSGYTETHHILPKSLGGSNNPINLIKLTAREHFICHWLLTKMTYGPDRHKMIYALNGMKRKNRAQARYSSPITARVYERLRSEVALLYSQRVVSDETKAKISASKKGKQNHPQTSDTREKIRTAQLGVKRKPLSEDHKAKISASHVGIPKPPASAERKQKISEAKTGVKIGPASAEHRAKVAASKVGKKLFVDPATGKRYMAFPTIPFPHL